MANDPSSKDKKLFFYFATVAPYEKAVYKAIMAFQKDYFKLGLPEVLYKYEQPTIDALAKEVATLMNCDASEVTYIKNTTEGVTIAAESLPLTHEDEILVLGNEYQANLFPWLKKKKEGYNVRVISGLDNAKGYAELKNAISPKTKAIAISWIQYYDGFITPLAELSRICREKGIFLIVDAVQGIGIRNLDLKETPVDMLVSGGQKYLRAGPGIGFIYVNKNILPKLKDTKVGIRSMESSTDTDYVLKNDTRRFQDGSMNLNGVVALHAAVAHINSIGIQKIEKKNLRLLRAFKKLLKENNIPFIDHGNHQGNIISMKVADPKGLVAFLKERNAYIKAIHDVARISFHHTSNMKEFTALVALIKEFTAKTSA